MKLKSLDDRQRVLSAEAVQLNRGDSAAVARFRRNVLRQTAALHPQLGAEMASQVVARVVGLVGAATPHKELNARRALISAVMNLEDVVTGTDR